MNVSIYKFKGKELYFPKLHGYSYMMFVNGCLNQVSWDFKRPLTDEEAKLSRRYFPFRETDIGGAFKIYFDIEPIKSRTAADKVKLFCMTYKARKGFSYAARQAEKNNIKNVTLSQDLLTTYFDNTSFPLSDQKSIADYIHHYNYIRDIARNGVKKKAKFPDEWDPTFEKRLNQQEAIKYYQYLTKLGWTRDRIRGVWHPPQS